MLKLQVKKQYFEMIKSGEMTERYYDISSHNKKRFNKYVELVKKEDGTIIHEMNVCFKTGTKDIGRELLARVRIEKGYGLPDWGAEQGKIYYVFKIIRVMEER